MPNQVIIKPVETKAELKKFVKFPLQLYKENKYFTPPFISDEMAMFSADSNAAYSYCDVKLFLAYRDNKVVGRIAGIINRAYNEKANVSQIRFSRVDFIDDVEVSSALFDAVKAYGKENKMTELIGPMGFSDLDKQGMLIEGFERPSMYITIYNYPYYVEHVQNIGFTKKIDWIEYIIDVPSLDNEAVVRLKNIAEIVAKRQKLTLHVFKNMKECDVYFSPALDLMNREYSELFGTVPLTREQLIEHEKAMKQITVPDFAPIVTDENDNVVAYGFLAPSLTKVMQKAKGHMLLAIPHLIKALSKFDAVDLYSTAVAHEYRKKGVNAMLLYAAVTALDRHGVKTVETGPMLETNVNIQSQWKPFNKVLHKRRRCWTLDI